MSSRSRARSRPAMNATSAAALVVIASCATEVLQREDYLPATENSDSFLVSATLLGDGEPQQDPSVDG
jgi:hypothetical protein